MLLLSNFFGADFFASYLTSRCVKFYIAIDKSSAILASMFNKRIAVARIVALVCSACIFAPHVHAFVIPTGPNPNPGDPLFCQPQEGTTFLIVNGGSGVFTADPDCYNNNANNDTSLSITTTQGGSLAGTRTPSAINYVYTPPTPGFTGLDTFSIPVTTVWNAAGGTGSAGGTARNGGPATLIVTLNVLPASVTLAATGPTLVAVPAGSVSSCTAVGNAGLGPAAGAVVGCVTGITRGSVSPAHGALTTSGNTYLYTPAAGYSGADTFTYQAYGVNTDGNTALNSGEITVNVTDVFLDFTFTPASSGTSTKTVMPGSSTSFTLSVAPMSGSYEGPVTFTATGLPPGATASFNPTSIAANAGAQTVTMTITTASAAQATPAPALGRPLAPLVLALLLLPFAARIRRNGRRLGGIVTVLLLLCGAAATAALNGCNQQNGYFMQPQQSYTVTVTATATPSVGSVLQHNTTLTLIVQ
jgi:hypothetical protein